jgi:hypothetical protein
MAFPPLIGFTEKQTQPLCQGGMSRQAPTIGVLHELAIWPMPNANNCAFFPRSKIDGVGKCIVCQSAKFWLEYCIRADDKGARGNTVICVVHDGSDEGESGWEVSSHGCSPFPPAP